MESLLVINLSGQDLTKGYPKILNDMLTKFAEESKDRYADKSIDEKERKAMGYAVCRDFVCWLASGAIPNFVVPKITKLQNNIASSLPE